MHIGSDVWVGGGAVILPGERIACADAVDARKSRRKVLEDCAGSGALLMPAHFGAPFLRHVDERGSRSCRASREAVNVVSGQRFNADRTAAPALAFADPATR